MPSQQIRYLDLFLGKESLLFLHHLPLQLDTSPLLLLLPPLLHHQLELLRQILWSL